MAMGKFSQALASIGEIPDSTQIVWSVKKWVTCRNKTWKIGLKGKTKKTMTLLFRRDSSNKLYEKR